MININGNDKCSCRSGKKFKDCCYNKGYLVNSEMQGYEYFDEKYMLQAVMNNDKKFKKFYRNERNKIKQEIHWFKKNNLGSNMSYGFLDVDDKKIPFIVNDSDVPIQVERALDTAHEIQHILCCQEGYKTVEFKQGFGDDSNKICKSINDMLLDPIVNGKIFKYGFDLEEYYKKADEIQISNIGIHSINDISYNQLIFITTLYVKKTLDYRNIYNNISDGEVEFNKWLKKYYPEVISTSKQILKLTDEVGFDTPQKVENIFENVINILNLNQILTINNI